MSLKSFLVCSWLWLWFPLSLAMRGHLTSLDQSVVAPKQKHCGEVMRTSNGELRLHCEKQLRRLRYIFDVPEPETILKENEVDLAEATEGTGKSGANMIFTKDKKYIIKTMSTQDINSFSYIIKRYMYNMMANSTYSELIRFYGVLEDKKGIFWMIGNNWIPVKFPILWDLKGSMVGRKNGLGSPVQKDQDWLDNHRGLVLTSSQREQVLKALESDTSLLARKKTIDYSLVLGYLEYDLRPCGHDQTCMTKLCHPSGACGEIAFSGGPHFGSIKDFYCDGDKPKEPSIGHGCSGVLTKDLKLYFSCFGLIDFLKRFGTKTSGEYLVRGGFMREISAQPPQTYRERFLSFVSEDIFPATLSSTENVALSLTAEHCAAWGKFVGY